MTPTILTRAVSRLLLAPTLAIAAAILVKGYVDVGDGFAAGVVVALGVLLQAIAFGHAAVADALGLRHAWRVAVAGLGVAVAVAVLPALAGRALLQHAPGVGEEVVHVGSLELLTAVAFDVGVFLLVSGALIAVLDGLARERVEEGPA